MLWSNPSLVSGCRTRQLRVWKHRTYHLCQGVWIGIAASLAQQFQVPAQSHWTDSPPFHVEPFASFLLSSNSVPWSFRYFCAYPPQKGNQANLSRFCQIGEIEPLDDVGGEPFFQRRVHFLFLVGLRIQVGLWFPSASHATVCSSTAQS